MTTYAIGAIRVIIRSKMLRDGIWWIAQGLEYDLVTQSRTPFAALLDFRDLLIARRYVAKARELDDPLAGIPPAPKRFEKLWNAARGRTTPITNTEYTDDTVFRHVVNAV